MATINRNRDRGICIPSISSDDRVRQGRSESHIHQQQKADEEAWLHNTLKQWAHDRRSFTQRWQWRRRLYEMDDGQQAIPAWLYHHPEDIGEEYVGHIQRDIKNRWNKRTEKIKLDEEIFSRELPLNAALGDRSLSLKGQHETDIEDSPLPWGAVSWDEVHGEPSKQSRKQKLVRAGRVAVSRLAHTLPVLHLRDYVGYTLDSRNIKWPAKYRFAKAGDHWTCQ